uniref:Thioredoxin domain-containing protein n=1 Tax=Coccolithus braarudii TaxID=221442 RepID=A0A7S0LBH7_9EUKA|mmetsp:Transcript_3149/g.6578  ORF Transcript_3149/g.6578 Transcript_3149/m.6578 type:complete len:254 (+) Transcript_3149:103-864(+)|eukprot:CAMPEP_0183333068 /NCGR_PEP_ID=MMETSP0164_2-20130417/2058_1 /TAXON_ID=221442 /ORGANISM="Coccolithus pelagicus ssp braarudi, Strain PLY182g" /LENGTH=253 /DNA_ID=CAMNT_0025501897 /DNA_START=95 /DNA_END=856 /DNA_ORIENTATION=+
MLCLLAVLPALLPLRVVSPGRPVLASYHKQAGGSSRMQLSVPLYTALLVSHCRSSSPILSGLIPARWEKVHDCQRPARWREVLITDEDCLLHKQEEELKAAASAKAGVYGERVVTLLTMDDFLEANALGMKRGRLVAVKFYSKRCRACLRIAAKYRRLSVDFEEQFDFYEAEEKAARPLCEALGVGSVPTLHVYDPNGVVKLSSGTYKPAELSKVDKRVRTAMRSMQQRPHLWRRQGERMIEALEALRERSVV